MNSFRVGQKVVYPSHGVGKVISIEKKIVMNTTMTFYTIQILDSGMKVMIPHKKLRVSGSSSPDF